MGDYTEMVRRDEGEKMSSEACMLIGDLLKEKTAELTALVIADDPNGNAIYNKKMEVDAIKEVYTECDSSEESKVVD